MRDNIAASPWLADEENERDHHQGRDRQYVEIIDIRQHGALPLQHPIEQAVGLPSGFRSAHGPQRTGHAPQHLLDARIGWIQMG